MPWPLYSNRVWSGSAILGAGALTPAQQLIAPPHPIQVVP